MVSGKLKTIMIKKCVVIGSGNVATHIAKALKSCGVDIINIYSPNIDNATELANIVNATATDHLDAIATNVDVIIFAIKDNALSEVVERLKPTKALLLHTSGSTSIKLFKDRLEDYGVLYPLQTLSKSREVDFCKVPLFVEGCSSNVEESIYKLAQRLSKNVTIATSKQRKKLHISAVFVCNFVNHMYHIAEQELKEENLPFELLYPLIDETAQKIKQMLPKDAQTGPAVRYDTKIIDAHTDMLKNSDIKDIYISLSKNINRLTTKNKIKE